MSNFYTNCEKITEFTYNIVLPRVKFDSPSYIPDSKNSKIQNIVDIKQHGPATIIFLKNGKKIIVKSQDSEFSPYIGLYVCLLKYLVSSKIYSDCIRYTFRAELIPKASILRGMVMSHIGKKELDKIYNKFFSTPRGLFCKED